MPSTRDPLHVRIELEVSSYLQEKGYSVHSQTYHDVLPAGIVKALTDRWSSAALYIRARADRLAIHPLIDSQFEFEAKSGGGPDLCLEVSPLLDHVGKWRESGIDCLYAFECGNTSGGFWASSPPPVRVIMQPRGTRYDNKAIDRLRQKCAAYFPAVKYCVIEKSNGSGDPFCVIDKSNTLNLPTWKGLIDAAAIAPTA